MRDEATGPPPVAQRGKLISVRADLQPELWVDDTASAVRYYERAFAAVVEHRVGGPDDADGIAQLAISGARFWVSAASGELGRFSPTEIGGGTGRMLLVVDDPQAVVDAAVTEGARLMSPVTEEHGWRLGRIVDPFGHEWEIGRPLGDWPPSA